MDYRNKGRSGTGTSSLAAYQQAEAVIFIYVWLFKVLDFTSNIEVQYSSPLWFQEQGVIHTSDTEYRGWGSDGTAASMAGLRPLEEWEPDRGIVRGGQIRKQKMDEDGND